MSEWAEKESRLLVQKIGAMIVYGSTKTDAVYKMLQESLDAAYETGFADAMKKEAQP